MSAIVEMKLPNLCPDSFPTVLKFSKVKNSTAPLRIVAQAGNFVAATVGKYDPADFEIDIPETFRKIRSEPNISAVKLISKDPALAESLLPFLFIELARNK